MDFLAGFIGNNPQHFMIMKMCRNVVYVHLPHLTDLLYQSPCQNHQSPDVRGAPYRQSKNVDDRVYTFFFIVIKSEYCMSHSVFCVLQDFIIV